MKLNSKRSKFLSALLTLSAGCASTHIENPSIPAIEYSNQLKATAAHIKPATTLTAKSAVDGKASLRLVSDGAPNSGNAIEPNLPSLEDTVTNDPGFKTYESAMRDLRPYDGPLNLGDPGMTASLWRENRGSNDIFRDQRAWQPMDLITIVVSENAEGSKQADTEVKSKSSIEAAINQLFNIDNALRDKDTIDPTALANASTKNEYKGEGETSRKGNLKATISAMVAEVLPSGILRIEGKKIIAVNNEEQVMVISGLVRPFDINSANEVDSSKIANMRIDYYGNGIVGEAQHGGWLGRILHVIWPF
jgi:flagellar L-ring protein FlgH